VALIPRRHRSSLVLYLVIALAGLWLWGKIDQRRQQEAEESAVESFEQQRVAEIVRRREADSKDLLAEVKKRVEAGEDRDKVKAWAEQRQRESREEAQREIDGVIPPRGER
jgi:tRNA U34 5-carboxymethylaminomethyl modifying GTPase MnmE/TrmE